MTTAGFYPPVNGVTYNWFLYHNNRAPYTGTLLDRERPSSEQAAASRARQLAHQKPGEWFGYGFWCNGMGPAHTAVAEYCCSAGGLDRHSHIRL
jgi:hypothetical protein